MLWKTCYLVPLLMIALAVVTKSEYVENILPQVTGGVHTVSGEAPSVVSIRVPLEVGQETQIYCSGTIVNANHIVTSCQCVHNRFFQQLINPFWFRIIAGDLSILIPSYQRFTTTASHIYTHPNYTTSPVTNDVAVMRTSEPFPFPHNTIDFAVRNTIPLPIGQECQFIGWGATASGSPNSHIQSRVNAPIIERSCGGLTIQDNMICAGSLTATVPPSGVCTGNIGGGLFCNVNNWWEFTGVLSFGVGCGAPNIAGVYMQVRDFNVWINQQFTRTDPTNPGLVVGSLPTPV